MNCYHCNSRGLFRSRDEYGLLEITCINCGRPQVKRPVDRTPPHIAETMEQEIGMTVNTYRMAARRRLRKLDKAIAREEARRSA